MAETLPKPIGFSDDLIRRIAMDIGKQVVDHIEHAYPAMFTVVAEKSAKLSIRNTTYNAIMAHMEAADQGRSETTIKRHEEHRREMRRLRKMSSP